MVRCSLCVFALGLSVPHGAAQTLLGAADVLDSLPPTALVGDVRGIALVPSGRGASAKGVLLVKDEGRWGDPAFVTFRTGVDFGARETPDYVLLFPTRRSLDRVTNGDGRIAPDVVVYASAGGALVRTTVAGATLRPGGLFSGTPDRKLAAELKAKLTERTAPKPAPEVKVSAGGVALPIDWAFVTANREALIGGLVTAGAWLVTGRRRKR